MLRHRIGLPVRQGFIVEIRRDPLEKLSTSKAPRGPALEFVICFFRVSTSNFVGTCHCHSSHLQLLDTVAARHPESSLPHASKTCRSGELVDRQVHEAAAGPIPVLQSMPNEGIKQGLLEIHNDTSFSASDRARAIKTPIDKW